MNEIIEKTINKLKQEKTILYPTDTIWGIGCSCSSSKAIRAIFNLKQRENSKTIILLVSSIEMLERYVNISPYIQSYLSQTDRPTTVIYKNPRNLDSSLIAEDNTVAIRIVEKGFAHELLKALDEPILSTSANISGQATAKNFQEISTEILEGVDYIVPLRTYTTGKQSSKIIAFEQDTIRIIRD